MANQERLTKLQKAVEDYVKEEKKRINEEIEFLKAIKQGRTGSAALQARLVSDASKDVEASLAKYLEG